MTTYQEACGPTDTPDDIDIDVLREKYLYERDKRLRPEGSTQYLELKGEWADFYEIDPYTPVTFRDPISEDTDVVVLGGGIAGLLAGAYLKKAGVEGVRVIEMAGDFGGVWYWNRFPGIQCDNDAYCYIPFLEELNFIPPKKFADGAEIFDEEVRRRGRDLRALPQHRKAFRPVRRRVVLHPSARPALGRVAQAVADQHEPR